VAAPYTYRPGGLLLKAVTVLMGLYVLVTLVSLVSDVMEWNLLGDMGRGVDVPQERIESNDSRQAAIGLAYMASYFVLAIVFLRCLYVLNKNARALGADDMATTPGWNVGWFFVPIASLFKPYQAVRDVWKASAPTDRPWRENPSSPLLGVWWALFLLSNVLGQATFRISMNAETIDGFQIASAVSIISGLVDVPLSAVALLLLHRLFGMQAEKHARFGAAGPLQPACAGCGEPLPPGASRCPVCGKEVFAFA